MINLNLARELMQACEDFQWDPSIQATPFNGGTLSTTDVMTLTVKTFMSDTDCFVTNNGVGDIVVGFRGSETPTIDDGGFRDWMGDFLATRTPYPPYKGHWPDRAWVHSGFWNAYEPAALPILALVQRQMSLNLTRNIKTRNIYVTGHSLGGSIAYLAALGLSFVFLSELPVHLYSFAAPRVGDYTLNLTLKTALESAYFVVFRGDPVPHVPPVGPNFPITAQQLIRVKIGPFTFGFGSLIPQFFQNYETGEEIVYIDASFKIQRNFPSYEVFMNFNDHNPTVYSDALNRISPPVEPSTPAASQRKKGNMPPILYAAMRP